MIVRVDRVGQRKSHAWRYNINFSRNHLRKLWLQIVKRKVNKSLSSVKIVLYEQGFCPFQHFLIAVWSKQKGFVQSSYERKCNLKITCRISMRVVYFLMKRIPIDIPVYSRRRLSI